MCRNCLLCYTILKAFDHTVKPVLLYSSEVWGMFNMASKLKKSKNDLIYDLYSDHKIEKLNLNLCEYSWGGSQSLKFGSGWSTW